jgi:hypothetical protein
MSQADYASVSQSAATRQSTPSEEAAESSAQKVAETKLGKDDGSVSPSKNRINLMA